MVDLEQEFQLLMQNAIKQINDKLSVGELTADEAEQLTRIVNNRSQSIATQLAEVCPDCGDNIEHCGWSTSMGYHCY
jgi:hypothetical protein